MTSPPPGRELVYEVIRSSMPPFKVKGYIPREVFVKITGRTPDGSCIWIEDRDSQRIHAHPDFIRADDPRAVGWEGG